MTSEAPVPLTYRSVRLGLRAPRVVIVVPGDDLWVTHVANALYAASRTWGGSGFVLAPAGPDVPDVLLRAIAAFDPDYVVGLAYTHSEMWALGLSQPPTNPDTGRPYDEAALAAHRDQLAFITRSDQIADATSVYRTDSADYRHRNVTTLGPSKASRVLREVPEPPILAPVEGAPVASAGPLGLALAMRLGFTHRPSLPYENEEHIDEPGAVFDLVLRGQPTPRSPGFRFDDAPIGQDAWQLTEQGVGWISRRVARPERLFVIGATLDDLCLALCWDRMQGHSSGTWVPESLYTQPENDRLGNALSLAASELEHLGGHVIVTSCSMTNEAVQEIVDLALAKAVRAIGLNDDDDRPSITVVPPDHMELRATHHLGFVPGEFDIAETLPVADQTPRPLEVMAPVPVHVPLERVEAGARRPDWEVDVDLGQLPAPRGRGLTARALVTP
jgi:hypothetical protein